MKRQLHRTSISRRTEYWFRSNVYTVPSPNGGSPPRRTYRSADYVIRHEGGRAGGLTIVRVPADRDRDRMDDIDESRQIDRRFATISSRSKKSRESFDTITSRDVDWRRNPLNGGLLSTCFVWDRDSMDSKIIRSEIDPEYACRRKDRSVEGTLIRSRRRIHLSRSSDRLPIVYGIKSCSRFKRSP